MSSFPIASITQYKGSQNDNFTIVTKMWLGTWGVVSNVRVDFWSYTNSVRDYFSCSLLNNTWFCERGMFYVKYSVSGDICKVPSSDTTRLECLWNITLVFYSSFVLYKSYFRFFHDKILSSNMESEMKPKCSVSYK